MMILFPVGVHRRPTEQKFRGHERDVAPLGKIGDMAPHRKAVGVVQAWQFHHAEGHTGSMNAASLVKQVIGHLALAIINDLDEPIHGDITARHVLSHTTGLPNWRPEGQPLTPLRQPGTRWGYSGEGFVLLQAHLEQRTGARIQDLARSGVFEPLGMNDSQLGDPEPGYHGYRPLMTTAADYARFLAHALTIDDQRWQPQVRIDDELAWGAGWGLETGPTTYGWQWGLNPDASNFVIGNPSTGDGVVVLTDDPNGRDYYTQLATRCFQATTRPFVWSTTRPSSRLLPSSCQAAGRQNGWPSQQRSGSSYTPPSCELGILDAPMLVE